jgi:hypothetical protein
LLTPKRSARYIDQIEGPAVTPGLFAAGSRRLLCMGLFSMFWQSITLWRACRGIMPPLARDLTESASKS